MIGKSSPVPFLFLYFKILEFCTFLTPWKEVLYSVAVRFSQGVTVKAEDLFLSNVCVGAFEFTYVYVCAS